LRSLGVNLSGKLTTILDVSGSLYETRYRYLDPEHDGFYETTIKPLFEPSGYAPLRSSYEDGIFGWRWTYGDFFAPSQDNRWALRYGLTWTASPRDKWAFDFSKRLAIDQGFSRVFVTARGDLGDPAYPWQWSNRIEHAPTICEDNVQTSLSWRRMLGAAGFLELQGSRYFYAQRQDVMGSRGPSTSSRTTSPTSTAPTRAGTITSTTRATPTPGRTGARPATRSRATSSAHPAPARAGGGLRASGPDRPVRDHRGALDRGPHGLGGAHDLWTVHPWVGSLWARDRLDFEGFTGNLGLRADYWFLGPEAEAAVADPPTRT